MSIRTETLDDSLARIKECGHEPALTEAVLEAFVLIDLYRAVLGYDRETAWLHEPLKGKNGAEIPDITLELSPSNNSFGENVVVEIKRYNHFDKREYKREEAIGQAARYIITKKSRYGIVTDGVRWTYFVVTGPARRKVAKKVAEFHIEESPQLGKLLLQRSSRSELLRLFEVLTRAHETITEPELNEIYKLKTLKERVQRVWNRGEAAPLSPRDRKLLRLMYRKDNFPAQGFCTLLPPRK